jgi:peptide-methionine (S)-S-oxide reductase
MRGVESVVSGYMGGEKPQPSYREVCTGTTGHVEVVQVAFDPEIAPYREILEVFFTIHDPTSRDRQGNDAGPQYRSVIFYHSEEQRRTAEDYHQQYFENNTTQPYCLFVVEPKVKKFREKFAGKALPRMGTK